jgi:3-dehydroquinate dehydratase type I
VTTRICVSILPKTKQEALHLIEMAEKAEADLIEIRLDCLENLQNLADLATQGKTPRIATNKPLSRQGMFSGTENERLQTLLDAADSGFEYVDIELSTTRLEELVREIKARGAKAIVSFHDYSSTPSSSELDSILRREVDSGADVCKIVTTARQIEDNLTILNFTSTASVSSKIGIVCFAMGELGKLSRLITPLMGGFFTFASLERGRETANGQMSIQEMKAAYKILGLK